MNREHLEFRLLEVNQLIDLAIMNGKSYQHLSQRHNGIVAALKALEIKNQ